MNCPKCGAEPTIIKLRDKFGSETGHEVVHVTDFRKEREAHAETRRKLGALELLISEIADESFGPFPVQTTIENLKEIESGIFKQRTECEETRRKLEVCRERLQQLLTVPFNGETQARVMHYMAIAALEETK